MSLIVIFYIRKFVLTKNTHEHNYQLADAFPVPVKRSSSVLCNKQIAYVTETDPTTALQFAQL
jgi:hypothetical protein